MRAIGIDVGARRIGLAISDATRTLARPLETIAVENDRDGIDRVIARVNALATEDDGVHVVVVGLPRRLDGTPTDGTARATALVDALRAQTSLVVVTEDERLTSVEAESRLARRERDWKKRKAKIDAAAAAIILQDYLDRSASG
ncbi:MAG TPA: Holliday junction resolvase RuvX [Vicinamibacterales bacterium]|nr:Holliday junction resolvase RuvX [Vicinamibacterales bacterium]